MCRAVNFIVMFIIIAFASFPAFSRGPLTFEERVIAQEAIERVYYAKRIWPKENPGAKPTFEKMVSRARIEAKVTDYLKKSVALDVFWQRPIKPGQLQAEMDRMAKDTRDRATLLEIFAALDNDPYLIAECVARPILADRLLRNWYAYDMRFHGDLKRRAEEALAAGPQTWESIVNAQYERGRTVLVANEDREECTQPRAGDHRGIEMLDREAFARWRKEAPPAGGTTLSETEDGFLLLATGQEDDESWTGASCFLAKKGLSIWWDEVRQTLVAAAPGGEVAGRAYFNLPMAQTQSPCAIQEQWQSPNSLSNIVDPRKQHTAVWTGTEMIVWGGEERSTGNRYNPSTDSWSLTSTTNCPGGRYNHTAVWTGSEMVIWGGICGSVRLNTGGKYNPVSDSWVPTSTATGCPTGRQLHTAVWTGSQMIVWGGELGVYLNTGGRYNPTTNSWATMSTTGAPVGRAYHTAVWTGSEMIVWGGISPTYLNSGGRYDPVTNSWVATSTGAYCPTARRFHTALWTGAEMIVWGGDGGIVGGRYTPASDTWAATSSGTDCPTARSYHVAVWTGTEMIIWGGGNYLNSGGRYAPASNSWVATSTGTNCPNGRISHTAVWTGTEMVIWGGVESDTGSLNTGGTYDPATDSWVGTSTGAVGYPAARSAHTAVWTGAEMIVWGGTAGGAPAVMDSGGKYDPATDSWSGTSTGASCPAARYGHSAVWTGAEMIVWGGQALAGYALTGGKYAPADDSWVATSTGGSCPTARNYHTAVWTGTEMIVWGGQNSSGAAESTGGKYNPASNSWSATYTGANCPAPRYNHTCVWTGSEMVVWGGSAYLNTGGKYNPASDSWVATSTAPGCPTGRQFHTAVWTGSEMIVWGGSTSGDIRQNTGGRYNPASDTWIATSTSAACPAARKWHTAVYTGLEMVIWGGVGFLSTGGRYNPTTDTWNPTSTMDCPTGRYGHTAVWTGTKMVVWGGLPTTATGGLYRPESLSISATGGLCPDGNVLLATQAGYASYQWFLDGGEILDATNPTYSTNLAGTYSVRVSDEVGCVETSPDFVLVASSPPTPSVSGASSGCMSTGITLSTGTFERYQWIRDGSDIAAATAQIYHAAVGGSYSVRVMNSDRCVGTSPEKAVTLYPNPTPAITGSTVNTCPATGVALTASGGFVGYRWSYNGVEILGANAPTYFATVSGYYAVTVMDAQGCEGASDNAFISVGYCATSEVSPTGAIYPARFVRGFDSDAGYYYGILFQKIDSLAGYNVYEGTIGTPYYNHANAPGNLCNAAIEDLGTGEILARIVPSDGNHYYLVTAFDSSSEGPSGYDSNGGEIPPGDSTCSP